MRFTGLLAVAILMGSSVQAAAAAPAKGTKAPGNDPKLVALALALEGCDFRSDQAAYQCKAALDPLAEAFAASPSVPTLVNLLEDPAEHVRFAAAQTLLDAMTMQQQAGRAEAERVLGAAAAERSAWVSRPLSRALLQGDFTSTSYQAKVLSLASTHPVEAMRAGLMSNLAVQDPTKLIPAMRARFAEERAPSVRLSILAAFYLVGREHAAQACAFSASLLDDADLRLAQQAAYNIVWGDGKCQDRYDDFLKSFEGRVQAAAIDFQYAIGTAYMARAKGATEAQRARFFKALEAVVAKVTLDGMVRAKALETLGEFAPNGKKLAAKYASDPDSFVSGAAKAIARRK